ncbi:MAG: phosphatase PAP2 family protein [Acidimicrobiales bacterium]
MRAGQPRAPLDAALAGLSRAADRGALWVAVAAVLAGAGGRFGRRAAMRGLLSAGLASTLANGLLKLAVRRRRPPAVGAAAAASGLRRPSTWSFPSGHAAVAAAFATGAGQELGVAAPALAGLAALIGWSRVRTGLHHPSDVAAGGAVGAAVALATRRLWPVAPHTPAEVRTGLAPAEAEPRPSGAGVVVVVNPSAGPGPGRRSVAEELADELPDAEVVELGEGDDVVKALTTAAERASVLGVAGGDGSVNAAAEVAARQGIPLLVVPGGTLNHFAHALGVETVADAARGVRDGSAVAVDLATIDGHPFLNAASVGSYVELVDAREALEGRIGKWPAVVVALWRVLRTTEPVPVEIDGELRRVWMVFIGNCRYHPSGFAPRWRERLDDGELDVRIVDGSRPLARARLLTSALTGRLARCAAYEQRFVRRLRVRSCEGPLRVARDGETFDGAEELTVAKADERLPVYVPRP